MRFGLEESVIKKICDVFSKNENISKAIIYGSRAKGNFRNNSDIDITLQGEHLTTNDLLKLETALDDLLLPWYIDLSIYHHIGNPDLRDHINRVGQVVFP